MSSKKQFHRWAIKFNSLPAKLIKDIEAECVKKANQYCQRNGLDANEYVVTTIRLEEIPFSFIVTLK